MNTDSMTTAQVAERLKCDVRTVHRMAEDGRLTPLLKIPGKRQPYLFDRSDVERLAAEQAEAAS